MFDLNLEHQVRGRQKHSIPSILFRRLHFFNRVKETRINESIGKLINTIERDNYQVVGFSLYSHNRDCTISCAKEIKKRLPNLKVFFGGYEVTDNQVARGLVDEFSFDAAIVGEAEHSILKVMDQFNSETEGISSETIPGVVYRNEKGVIVEEGPPKECKDLDQLPFPDFTGFKLNLYTSRYSERESDENLPQRLPISFSRGCVGKCVFCTSANRLFKFRYRSVDNIIDEIKVNYHKYGVKDYYEHGQLMNGNFKVLKELTERLIVEKFEISWGGFCRLDRRLTEDFLKKMYRAGCRIINYGVESGSQRVLDLMRKQYRLEDAYSIIRNTSKAGIEVKIGVIVGFPGETWYDYFKTIKFIFRLKKSLNQVNINVMQIHKDARIYSCLDQFDVMFSKDQQENWSPTLWTAKSFWRNNFILRRFKSVVLYLFVRYFTQASAVFSS